MKHVNLRSIVFLPATLIVLSMPAKADPFSSESTDTDQRAEAAELTVEPRIGKLSADTLHADPAPFRAIEEIIVIGNRKRKPKAPDPSVFGDPLRTQVMSEVRELRLLDEEFEWRTDDADFDIEPPRFRIGYDPRNDARLPGISPQVMLPIDLVRPATLITVDF